MPDLTKEFIKEKLEMINSQSYRVQRDADLKRFQIFNGNLYPAMKEAILEEFKKVETVEALCRRMVPINIIRKIVTKLAGLYVEAPIREASDDNESDQVMIDLIEDSASLNSRMKEANRYFKLWKRNLIEPFVDDFGMIRVRNLPKHCYEVFSHSSLSPEIPDTIVKILKCDPAEPTKCEYSFWTDQEFKIVNGNAEVLMDRMMAMNNPDGINPYGVLPFVYINEASYSVNPLPNDDLLRLATLIPILLSDLAFASKYQTWGIIFTIGYDGDLPVNPNSVISLPFGPDGEKPEIGTVKPEFSMDSALSYIQALIDFLLTTNNLSTNAIHGQLNAQSPASGIAKALDEAESTEDKKDQQDYFLNAEYELWDKLANNLLPTWKEQGALNPKFFKGFSDGFEITVILKEPRIFTSEKELIEIAKMKIDNELSTLRRELEVLYPSMTPEQIEKLEKEIDEAKAKKRKREIDLMVGSMKPFDQDEQNNDDMDMEDEEMNGREG